MALGLLYRIYERNLRRGLDVERLPRHIGVVLDGHRRHAREEGLASYTESYRAGMARFEEFLAWANEFRIPAVTAWVLSKENLSRPVEELDPYFDVLVELFERLPAQCEEYDMSIRVIGSLDLLPDHLVAAAKTAEQSCREGTRRLNIAMGYGGRQEIVDAAKDLVEDLIGRGVADANISSHITADSLAAHMYSADIPDPDLRRVSPVRIPPLAVRILRIRSRRRQLAGLPTRRLSPRPSRLHRALSSFRPIGDGPSRDARRPTEATL